MGDGFSAIDDFSGSGTAAQPAALLGAAGQLLADGLFYRGFRPGLHDAGAAAVEQDGAITVGGQLSAKTIGLEI